MKNNILKIFFVGVIALTMVFVFATFAFAASTNMPWEGPLNTILNSITGPVAKVIGVIAIVLTGLGFAMSEGGDFMKKGLGICFGLSIAFTASSVFLPMFGFTSGIHF